MRDPTGRIRETCGDVAGVCWSCSSSGVLVLTAMMSGGDETGGEKRQEKEWNRS